MTFLKERGGPAVDACRTLLREDYASGVASRDAWLLGESNAVRDLYWYQRFKLGLIAALRTVYETDKATFKRWSTDGGRLPFPRWDKANKTNTTCWRVWEAVDQTPREVSYAEWKATLERLNSPRTLALRLTLTDSLAFDFSHLTVVDGDDEQFKAAADAPTVAQPPLFPAVTALALSGAEDDALLRRLSSKALPNLQTLTLHRLDNITDAGLSSLSGYANLQTLKLWNLNVVTDFALAKLAALRGLRSLSLSRCGGFTGVGVAALGAASNLRSLEFWKCDGASSADVDALRKRLPNSEIRFTPRD